MGRLEDLREWDLRPEFRDPSRFPCAAVGCEERAAGWVLHEAVGLHNLGDLEVQTAWKASLPVL